MYDLAILKKIIVEWAVRHPSLREVYVFGSYAKGKARPESDLDVAVSLREDGIEGLHPDIYWNLNGDELENDLSQMARSKNVKIRIHLEYFDNIFNSTPRIEKALDEATILVFKYEST